MVRAGAGEEIYESRSKQRIIRCGVAGGLGNSVSAGLERHSGDGCDRHQSRRQQPQPDGPIGSAGSSDRLADDRRASDECFQRPCNSSGTTGEIERKTQQRERGGPSDRSSRASGILADANGRQPGQTRGLQSGGKHGLQSQGGRSAEAEHDTRPTDGFWGAADWLFSRDGKWRPVEPGTFPLAHGISGRVGLLRGYGNAINPHQAAPFIQAFEEAIRDDCIEGHLGQSEGRYPCR